MPSTYKSWIRLGIGLRVHHRMLQLRRGRHLAHMRFDNGRMIKALGGGRLLPQAVAVAVAAAVQRTVATQAAHGEDNYQGKAHHASDDDEGNEEDHVAGGTDG